MAALIDLPLNPHGGAPQTGLVTRPQCGATRLANEPSTVFTQSWTHSYQHSYYQEAGFLGSSNRGLPVHRRAADLLSNTRLDEFRALYSPSSGRGIPAYLTQLRFDLFDSFIPLVKVFVNVGLVAY